MINNINETAGDQLVHVVTIEESDEMAVLVPTEVETSLTRRNQRGMVSAEWAVGIIAAVAMAGVLLAVVTSGPVKDAMLKVVLTIIRTFAG